jgi:1-acyl-sn-glycerol-3-phosphate acyltransferase
VKFSQLLIVGIFRGITSLICRIDDAQLESVPSQGPLIVYTNHINLVEIPIIYTHLQPRRVHGMVLASRWENPILRKPLDITESIPLHRGEADIAAIRRGLAVLEKGEILLIAPEGTRSHTGQLQAAHAGVVVLGLHSGAPLLPVAFFGAENYAHNLSRLKRTDFHIRVGRLIHLETRGEKMTRQVREMMLEELMVQLAKLLPEESRGRYGDATNANMKYVTPD